MNQGYTVIASLKYFHTSLLTFKEKRVTILHPYRTEIELARCISMLMMCWHCSVSFGSLEQAYFPVAPQHEFDWLKETHQSLTDISNHSIYVPYFYVSAILSKTS